MEHRARVLIDCEDEKGLVYKISKVFYDRDLKLSRLSPLSGLIFIAKFFS